MGEGVRAVLIAALLLVGIPAPGRAAPVEVGPQLERLADPELGACLGFLEERLEAGRLSAQGWQYGWTGVYGVTTTLSAVQTLLADDADDRVYNLVGAVKSAGGLAQLLLDPLPARLGAAAMQEVPATTRRGRLERLAVGERQLFVNAARAEQRYSLRRHLEGVTTNVIGGAVIWAFGSSSDAVVSTLSGIAVGELQIWTQPWRATGDLEDYRNRFTNGSVMGDAGWQLRPRPGGVELALRF
jgi:hypothetical protein